MRYLNRFGSHSPPLAASSARASEPDVRLTAAREQLTVSSRNAPPLGAGVGGGGGGGGGGFRGAAGLDRAAQRRAAGRARAGLGVGFGRARGGAADRAGVRRGAALPALRRDGL